MGKQTVGNECIYTSYFAKVQWNFSIGFENHFEKQWKFSIDFENHQLLEL